MTQPHDPDPMRPSLTLVERELEQRLEEACAMRNVSDESTGELMRLEETLLDAARAAKHAVSVRRRMRSLAEQGGAEEGGQEGEGEQGRATAADRPVQHDDALPGLAAAPADTTIRNFVDADGVEWQVWEVTPHESPAGRSGTLLAAYRNGWLAFESLDGIMRRRLPNFPRDWCRVSDEELEKMLGEAEEARRKR
jgi:hypothetical protein